MAKCPKCGTELAAFARFCSNCGYDTGAQPATTANATQAYGSPSGPPYGGETPGNNQKTGLYIGGGLVALAIIAFFIARAAGLFSGAKAEAPATGVLSAPQTQVVAAPVLNAPEVAAPAAPVLRAPQMASPPPPITNPMPADVIDYLRWLKQFDIGRQQLSSKGEAQMMLVLQEFTKEYMTGQSLGLLDGDSGDSRNPQQQKGLDISPINNVIQDWNKATTLFMQKQPPAPCTTLASNYKGALATAVSQMTQVTSAFLGATQSIKNSGGQKTADAQQTLESLMQEKNGRHGSQSIDGSLTSANDALDAVRNQYTDIPPDIDAAHFSIKADGSSLKLPGLPF
ncbi:MAG: zinc ribbon domain-containing protein [Armatimonadota bacterium]